MVLKGLSFNLRNEMASLAIFLPTLPQLKQSIRAQMDRIVRNTADGRAAT